MHHILVLQSESFVNCYYKHTDIRQYMLILRIYCQYCREEGLAGVQPRGPRNFCYCKIVFKKPFVGRSFASSLRTSLLVSFVLILGCIMEYQCFITVLNRFAFVVAPLLTLCCYSYTGAPRPELALDEPVYC